MRLAASSDTLSEEALTRIVEKDVIPALVSIDGVATVYLFGDRERLLRVVVDPLRLTSFGLSVGDVAAVLRNAPFDLPAGSFRSEDQELIVRADATVATADQVRHLTIRDSVAIGDVAEVYFGRRTRSPTSARAAGASSASASCGRRGRTPSTSPTA